MNVTQFIAVQKNKNFSSQRSGRWNGLDIPATCKTPKEITTCDWRSKYPTIHICIVKSWCVLWCGLLSFWCSPLSNDAFSQMHQGVHPLPPSQVGHFKGGIMVWKPELHSSCCRWWVTFSFNAISILKINSFHLCFPFWPQYVAAEVLPKKQDID